MLLIHLQNSNSRRKKSKPQQLSFQNLAQEESTNLTNHAYWASLERAIRFLKKGFEFISFICFISKGLKLHTKHTSLLSFYTFSYPFCYFVQVDFSTTYVLRSVQLPGGGTVVQVWYRITHDVVFSYIRKPAERLGGSNTYIEVDSLKPVKKSQALKIFIRI